MQTTHHTPLELGTPVYGSDGEKIGEIAEVQPEHFVIEKGFIFTTDIYVPITAIASRDGEGVRLSLTKQEVENGDWSTLTGQDDRSGTYAATGTNGENGYDTRAEDITDRDDETQRP